MKKRTTENESKVREKDGARGGRGSLESNRVNRGNAFAHLREHLLKGT